MSRSLAMIWSGVCRLRTVWVHCARFRAVRNLTSVELLYGGQASPDERNRRLDGTYATTGHSHPIPALRSNQGSIGLPLPPA